MCSTYKYIFIVGVYTPYAGRAKRKTNCNLNFYVYVYLFQLNKQQQQQNMRIICVRARTRERERSSLLTILFAIRFFLLHYFVANKRRIELKKIERKKKKIWIFFSLFTLLLVFHFLFLASNFSHHRRFCRHCHRRRTSSYACMCAYQSY